VDERSRFTSELNGDLLITASHSLGESIKLNSLVGVNINDRKANNFHAYVTELGIDNFYNLSNSPNPPASTRVQSHRRLLGVYGQVEASYNDYLFVNLQARNDWSSTLPPGGNSFFYPGANVSFVFTEAMDISGPLSFGKVRASIGQTGNDADPYDVYSIATPGSVSLPHGDIIFPLSGVNAYEVYNELGNLNLQPEITTEYEFGADLRFFNSRLNIDATYYNGLTRGQILKVDIPFTSGYSRRISNIGKVRNSGIELLISGVPVRTENFSWEMSANYTKNVSRVEELMDGLDKVTLNEIYDLNYVAKVGKPLGMIQGYDVERDPQGRVVVNAADGFPKILPEKVDFGSTVPDFTLGFSNTFTYKGVGLSFLFDYRHGAWMYSYTRHLNFFVGNATQTLYNDRQPFVVPNSVIDVGDDDEGNPIYVENSTPIDMENVNSYWYHSQNPSRGRDFLVEKTFLKLREVVIGYDIPRHILSKTPISALNISVVGRNLWLWTPKDNNQIDPEASNFGNDLMSELGEFAVGPTVRSMGFSIKATF
jgi:outer membrane receptor protein involved in Fe transport